MERYIGCKEVRYMIKSLAAKFVYEEEDMSGKEVLKTRTLNRLSVHTGNDALLRLSEAYGNLKGEKYVNVFKVITEEVN